ncbi:MAG: EamA family transporter [Rhodospirillaceae bacterium]|jgi:drug/metabolite transporter (DMT)-like permease|nr:EamA family transporter [Rhodospirillaceae bacterium]MBT4116664.1 EamA family transporter [Rhodospirillaceae bacterium]MBT4720545.1 EamA family transporter [Rhodospirillaceae bacterium]MBT4748909.1 EamA family transporter [Rhodospirillaceae bacterium]MBT5180042.1 EamA family transporter [Rhodospirillaceae bacterium]
MEIWVITTIAAAFLQNVRNSLQKSINSVLSTSGAAYTRFAFGLPLAAIYWFALRSQDSQPLEWEFEFWGFAALGGIAQILAMWFLLRSFQLRSFAVGTAYSKTETFQAAVFTIVLLGEAVSGAAFVAIAISFVGVCFLSLAKMTVGVREFLTSWTNKGALMGLANGAMLGLSAVSYRGAALSLGGDSAILAAAATLVVALSIQTVVMTVYLKIFEVGELSRVWQNRGKGTLVGIASMLGSAGWFTAMTLQNVAYVRAVGQVELIFTFLTAILIFRESIRWTELLGTALIIAGILFLLVD